MGNVKKIRKTIGENPLDVLLSPVTEGPTDRSATNAGTARRKAPTQPKDPSLPKRSSEPTRATFHLPNDLVEEARDVVVALSGPPLRLTLAAFAENALRAEIERLKRKYNDGAAFPRREGTVRVGRPIGSISRGRR